MQRDTTALEKERKLALASSVEGSRNVALESYALLLEAQVLVQTTKMKVSGRFHPFFCGTPC